MTRKDITLIVMVDPIPLEAWDLTALQESQVKYFFSFLASEEQNQLYLNFLRRHVASDVQLVVGWTYLPRASQIARQKLLDFVRDWPLETNQQEQNFKGLFRDEHGQTLWWYNQCAEKNTLGRPTFRWLCLLEALLLFCQDHAINKAALLTTSQDLAELAYDCFKNLGILSLPLQQQQRRSCHLNTKLNLIKARLKSLLYGTINILLAKLLTKPPQPLPPTQATGFVTDFPRSWIEQQDQKMDRYFETLPRQLSQHTKTFYLGKLMFLVYPTSPVKIYRALKQQRAWAQAHPLLCLENYYSLKKWLKNHLNLSWIVQGEKFLRWSLEQHAQDRPYSCLKLLQGEIRESYFIHYPVLTALEDASSRFAKILQPSQICLYTFEYVWGRAIIRGLRNAHPAPQIVALQHAPINRYNLVPVIQAEKDPASDGTPLADHHILDGPASAELFISQGFKPQQFSVLGPPRLDRLTSAQHPQKNTMAGKKMILAAAGLHDFHTFIPLIFSTMAKLNTQDDLVLCLKHHPKAEQKDLEKMLAQITDPGVADPRVADPRMQGKWPHVTYQQVHGDILAWIPKATIFITAASSTGLEAAFLGKPVICVAPSDGPDLSPFANHQEGLMTVHTQDELYDKINRILRESSYRDHVIASGKLLSTHILGPLDGKACERIVQKLLQLRDVS